jgi:hypothetical protein
MAKLSSIQTKFLAAHDIPLSRVFDASNLSAKLWKQAMMDLDMWVAYGGAKCAAAGHQLRARNSDCLQCRPAAIGYIKRYLESGEVYIAASKSIEILKVGAAKDSIKRIKQLNYYEYGGASDWTLQSAWTCETACKIEFEVHRILNDHRHYATYFKNGEVKECRELFRCSISVAAKAVNLVLNADE